jgi:aspartyl-tRNA(Asn)/glutamyl-tRNA(Gln) amidotransferase subunit A
VPGLTCGATLAGMSEELVWRSVAELSAAIQGREVSPVEVTEQVLARIDRLDPELGAFVTVTRERALAEARAAEAAIAAGSSRGPLHGVPYAVKDLFDVAGLPTMAGCRLLIDNVAERDGAPVRRMAAAGMVLVGKTHTVQFAFGGVGINHDAGTPHNPWHPEPHAPGGSSSGSAVAVAAGMVPVALGTDTGGSVRAPAALCGTAGLKTTVGRVSRAGVFPLSSSLDSVGPLARTVEDCALVYEVLQGADPDDESTMLSRDGQAPHDVLTSLRDGVRGLRLAFAETVFFDGTDPDVEAAVRATADVFASLGASVTSMAIPEVDEVMGHGDSERARSLFIAAEGCAFNRTILTEHFDQLDPVVSRRLQQGFELSAADYFDTQRRFAAARAGLQRRLADVDALLVPTTMIPAHPIAEIDVDAETYARFNGQYLRNTAIGNLLGLCAVSTPCGFTAGGLPIGLMVYAKPFAEETALRVANAYEQATHWHRQHPPV